MALEEMACQHKNRNHGKPKHAYFKMLTGIEKSRQDKAYIMIMLCDLTFA